MEGIKVRTKKKCNVQIKIRKKNPFVVVERNSLLAFSTSFLGYLLIPSTLQK